ncbi:hypothetical protein [Streptomyces sp. NPDC059743]|uniref:hypothetical protein n=1 Tax=Streptomyces sp. NPDC059743 TaxID=3346928 RepID=UPI00365C6F86
MSSHNETLRGLFPDALAVTRPVTVAVGERFEVVTLPEVHARAVLARFAYRRPHPVGAAVADNGRWSLVLPTGSEEPRWPSVAHFQNKGWLRIPPVSSSGPGTLHWARFGNEVGCAFTAPLLLNFALAARESVSVAGGAYPSASRADAEPGPLSRIPVRA